MVRALYVGKFVAVAAFLCSTVSAWPLEMIPATPPPGDLEVIQGAEPVHPNLWPATFIFRSAGGGCTSTAIGTRVILTAAHCVANGDAGTVAVGQPTNVVCDHHPEYGSENSTTDFALCKTDTPMAGFALERISTSLAFPRVGQLVTILGYGCTTQGGFDANFGVLHQGQAAVVRTPQGSDIDTITKGGAAVCFGDSGGAAYFATNSDGTQRQIVGVNSRGDISAFSFLSSTATLQFVDWALAWSQQNQVEICGLHASASGCRF